VSAVPTPEQCRRLGLDMFALWLGALAIERLAQTGEWDDDPIVYQSLPEFPAALRALMDRRVEEEARRVKEEARP
jgi:hypothetical protein